VRGARLCHSEGLRDTRSRRDANVTGIVISCAIRQGVVKVGAGKYRAQSVPISEALFSLFFLYHVLLVNVQELTWLMRYGVKKMLIPITADFTSSWETSNTPNSKEKSPLPSTSDNNIRDT